MNLSNVFLVQLPNFSLGSSLLLLLLLLLTSIGFSPGGSGYFTCIQNMKLVTSKFRSGGLHEKHVVATWNLGNHLTIAYRRRETKKNLCRGGRSQDLLNTDF